VLGGELEPCGIDPLTGFYRDGCCRTGPEDRGSHTICAVVTAAFLEHQRRIGNDLVTPMPQYRFPGLEAGPSLSTSGETLTIEESMNLEGENGERRTCWSRARMELGQRLRLLPPAAKTSAA
jgi:uncharacterized protein (DUF2237 family)